MAGGAKRNEAAFRMQRWPGRLSFSLMIAPPLRQCMVSQRVIGQGVRPLDAAQNGHRFSPPHLPKTRPEGQTRHPWLGSREGRSPAGCLTCKAPLQWRQPAQHSSAVRKRRRREWPPCGCRLAGSKKSLLSTVRLNGASSEVRSAPAAASVRLCPQPCSTAASQPCRSGKLAKSGQAARH